MSVHRKKRVSPAEMVDRFKSPMPAWEDDLGLRFVPFWQTAIAALAAVGSLAFAWLLFTKL